MIIWEKTEVSISIKSSCGNYRVTGVKVKTGDDVKDDEWRYVAWKLGRRNWEILDVYDSAAEAKARCEQERAK